MEFHTPQRSRCARRERLIGEGPGGSWIGPNAAKAKARPQKMAITPPQISMEMRAQFFKRSTPTLVKMPKIARPANTTIIATTMDFANAGIAGAAFPGGIMLRPTIAATAMRIASRLASIPITPAATTELERPEGFMAQLYIISTGATIVRRARRTLLAVRGKRECATDQWGADSGRGGSSNWRFTLGKRKKKIHQRLMGNTATIKERARSCLNNST